MNLEAGKTYYDVRDHWSDEIATAKITVHGLKLNLVILDWEDFKRTRPLTGKLPVLGCLVAVALSPNRGVLAFWPTPSDAYEVNIRLATIKEL